MPRNAIAIGLTACVAACAGRAGPTSPAEEAATAGADVSTAAQVDASLEPGEACAAWVTILVEQPESVPVVEGAIVSFHGRVLDGDPGMVPDPVRDAATAWYLDFDMDVAERVDGGIRCAGLLSASNAPGMEAGEATHVEDLVDGLWQAAYLLDLDLVSKGEALVASRGQVISMQESYRVGENAFRSELVLGDPDLPGDLDGDGRMESVTFGYIREELASPLTREVLEDYGGWEGETSMYGDVGDIRDESLEMSVLLIQDEDQRVLYWESWETDYADGLDYYDPPATGSYDMGDIGLGRPVFVWTDPWEYLEPACLLEGEEDYTEIEIDERPTYLLFDGEDLTPVFTWEKPFEDGKDCDAYPVEVAFETVEAASGGPHEIRVDLSFDTDEASWTDTEVWRFDGVTYVLSEIEKAR